jgi:hypothetical protein
MPWMSATVDVRLEGRTLQMKPVRFCLTFARIEGRIFQKHFFLTIPQFAPACRGLE